jgi:hypothetical protein
MSTIRRCAALVCPPLFVLSSACGSAEQARDDLGFGAEPRAADAVEEPDEPGSFLEDDALPRPLGDPEGCAVQHIPLRSTRRSIDIIVVLDNSVSMALELDAVERSINRNFASVLDEKGADYRVILLSRHRNAARHQSESAETAICITQPLSALDTCPAQRPGLTPRFFHYAVDIDSTDSLARIIETLDEPDPLYHATEVGWREWLRAGSRKIFLEFSDDDSLDNGRDFTRRLMSRAPEHFGTDVDRPDFVFHSIIGVAERAPAGTAYEPDEPLVTDRCAKNGGLAPSSGQTYQGLSRASGGLRYPLCALDDYGAIFEDIARDGVRRSGLACSFDVPNAPAGKRLDTERIQLMRGYAGDDGAALVRVDTLDGCHADAFYIEDDRSELCPDLCEQLTDVPSSTVSAEFDCSSYVDLR